MQNPSMESPVHNERCTPGSGRGARRPTASTQHGAARLFHVIAQKNKPTEIRSKEIIYELHLEPRFKDTPLDEIDVSAIARLRADLVEKKLSEKRINNILAVLSKPLHYALECNVIGKVPRMGLFKCERPEIEAWD